MESIRSMENIFLIISIDRMTFLHKHLSTGCGKYFIKKIQGNPRNVRFPFFFNNNRKSINKSIEKKNRKYTKINNNPSYDKTKFIEKFEQNLAMKTVYGRAD